MKIPYEMMKVIRESGYNKKLVYNYIRELLDSEKRKHPKELQIARKALREEDRAAKKDGGVVDWNYLLTRMD